MTQKALDRLLKHLEAARNRFGRTAGKSADKTVVSLLKQLDAARIADPSSLLRFHEALLFLSAFPQSPAVVRVTERILKGFHKKVEALRQADADMDAFDDFDTSGIAGTQMEDTVSFEAEAAAEGFEDVNSTATLRVLQKTMRKEETALLGGNASLALGTPAAPILSASGTGGTLPAATYSCLLYTSDAADE